MALEVAPCILSVLTSRDLLTLSHNQYHSHIYNRRYVWETTEEKYFISLLFSAVDKNGTRPLIPSLWADGRLMYALIYKQKSEIHLALSTFIILSSFNIKSASKRTAILYVNCSVEYSRIITLSIYIVLYISKLLYKSWFIKKSYTCYRTYLSGIKSNQKGKKKPKQKTPTVSQCQMLNTQWFEIPKQLNA